MLESLLDTQTVLCRTESDDIALEKQDDGSWAGDSLQLTIKTEPLAHGVCLKPTLKNDGGDISLESLRLLDTTLSLDPQGLRFLRFGLRSPGDTSLFGTLTHEGVLPEPVKADDGCFSDSKDKMGLMATSLLALAPFDRSTTTVIGAGTFRLTEGTIHVSAAKGTPGSFSVAYEMVLDGMAFPAGATVELDQVIILQGAKLYPLLTEWADVTAGQCGALVPDKTPTGWNDWQFYRNEKSQEHVRQSAKVIADLRNQGYPLDFIQIDGGFCLHLSEWREPGPRFADGIGKLSAQVREMGLQFGLWFAPYIQNVKTKVVQEHPDWLLLDKTGKQRLKRDRSNVGPCYLIDFTVPAALEWLRDQIRFFVDDWHVRWIKLDGPHCYFYRDGRLRDRSQTVTQMLAKTFDVIREAAGPESLVEGEGIMGPALGRVDLHRMQQDNHPAWYPNNDSRRPHAGRVYGNEMLLAFLHGRWWCNHRENVILRDFPSPYWHGKQANPDAVEPIFTDSELHTQLTAAVLGSGGILLTDPMPDLMRTPARVRLISRILPPYHAAAEFIDEFPDTRYPGVYRLIIERPFETYTVLGLINWSDETVDVDLALADVVPADQAKQEFYAFSFFDGKLLGAFKDRIRVEGVSVHGAKLIALRSRADHPQLVSTSMHLLQGAVDLDDVQWHAESITLEISVKHFIQEDEKLFLAAPEGWHIKNIATNAARFSVDDYDPTAPSIRFDGTPNGGVTRFALTWEKKP